MVEDDHESLATTIFRIQYLTELNLLAKIGEPLQLIFHNSPLLIY